MVTVTQIKKTLDTIPDPELGVSIVALGLIYNVSVDTKGVVTIIMTLTSVGCPLFDSIETSIKEQVGKIKGVTSVTVELTFEPPWTPDTMSKEAKMQLGLS